MNTLVIKHIDCEGLGTLQDVFARHGVGVTLAHPYRGEPLPELRGHHFLVLLGGPMGIYERDRYSFIAESELVRQAVSLDIPTLGICLGSQIVADALGGRGPRRSAR
jgi:GMP synthase (glutamine-hydrolysing)